VNKSIENQKLPLITLSLDNKNKVEKKVEIPEKVMK